MAVPFSRDRSGVRISVRLNPGAGRTGIDGLAERAGGHIALKARVTAAPEKGKANDALLKLLSKTWGIPKSRMTVVAGRTDRNKIIHVDGEPDALMQTLTGWLNTSMRTGAE